MLVLSRCDQPGCDGVLAYDKGSVCDGKGCGEPCAFRMGKSGHGSPPFPIDWRNLLLEMLTRCHENHCDWLSYPTDSEMADLIAAAGGEL